MAMCIAQGMILLDVTIVNVALPSIQRELHESPGGLEWVISAYALSLAALIPLSGSLGDRFGRKRFFAAGMAVFTAGSAACALSASAGDLIAARALQGVGGAVMSALALSILSGAYSGKARAGAIGIWATCAGLGFGLGPVVGGLLLGAFGWSSIFWVNVPFGVAGIALTVTVVPESRNPAARPVDVPGVLTSAAGLLALAFGLIESASRSWTSAPVLASLAAGLVLLAWFAWWERRAPFPMIPPQVARLRSFTISCGIYLLCYAALTGVYFYLTLLYQDVDGWTALRTGLSWLFMNIPFLVIALCAGPLARRLPASAIASGGCLVTAAGILTFSTLTPASPFAIAVTGYVLFGAGTGMWIPGVAKRRHARRPPRPVGHRVRGIQRLPPGRHLDRPGDPRRHRHPRRHHRLDHPGRSPPPRSPPGSAPPSPQRRQRPHRPGNPGAREGLPGSRRTGLHPRLPRRNPHRSTVPHRRRDPRHIRATPQPQAGTGRSCRQTCITRRPR